MAVVPFPRRYVSMLSHLLGWVLLGYLLFFYKPFSSDVVLPNLFWVRQAIFFGLMAAMFYLNALVLVPRLLLAGQTSRYLIALAGVMVVIFAILTGVEFGFNLPVLVHRAFHPDGSGTPKLYGWVQPNLFTALLMLGSSTSLAMLQKWQTDTNLRLMLEQAKTTSELSFLKAQINPHFFFNTLNNIYALTLIDGDTAREALHRLSRMMRYVLYETQSDATLLSKELAFISDYIQLMQLRLTDKVDVVVDFPDPLQDRLIAPMLLLPFVENAFKHGVSASQASRIHIVLGQHPDHLSLDVYNTVFSTNMLSLEAAGGIGLANTRRRLDLLYPEQYLLQIDEHTPAGEYHVHLTLTLP
ncbi:hypothetical protein GGR92_003487 [Spirosoma lacussanchae]|uniref:sensor histidine kinase n=1 Tax=Spirosoma lacussanchae TaxID=1884249 RepID=UPI0011086FC9|nr:histidine kinase [Spirosoma lacussanchae]